MEKQQVNQLIQEEVCIAEKLCNEDNPLREETISFCGEYLDGFNDDYLKNLCEKYQPTECDIKECTVYLDDNITGNQGTVTTSFRDVIVKIKGVEPILRLPPLYPKDCTEYGGPSSSYASCPCCFCNHRNARGSGSGASPGQPMVPGKNKCINKLDEHYDLIYLPRYYQELKLNDIVSPIIKISDSKGGTIEIDVRKIIDIPNDFIWSKPQLLIEFLLRKNVTEDDIKDIFKYLKPAIKINRELSKYYLNIKREKYKLNKINYYPIYRYLIILMVAVVMVILF